MHTFNTYAVIHIFFPSYEHRHFGKKKIQNKTLLHLSIYHCKICRRLWEFIVNYQRVISNKENPSPKLSMNCILSLEIMPFVQTVSYYSMYVMRSCSSVLLEFTTKRNGFLVLYMMFYFLFWELSTDTQYLALSGCNHGKC